MFFASFPQWLTFRPKTYAYIREWNNKVLGQICNRKGGHFSRDNHFKLDASISLEHPTTIDLWKIGRDGFFLIKMVYFPLDILHSHRKTNYYICASCMQPESKIHNNDRWHGLGGANLVQEASVTALDDDNLQIRYKGIILCVVTPWST